MKKIPQYIKDRLLDFMAKPDYRPQKDHHLAVKVGLKVKDRAAFRTLLKELAEEGLIKKKKGNLWILAQQTKRIEGVLSLSPRGHGFVRCPYPIENQSELFIPPDAVGGALHGDQVLCEIVRTKFARGPHTARKTDEFKPEGRIVKVLERKKKLLVGLLMKSSAYWYVIPDSPRVLNNVYVTLPKKPLRTSLAEGRHKVVVRLADNQEGDKLTGTIIEDLGDPDKPGVDVLSILREHEIPEAFSSATEKESHAQAKELSAADFAGRLDLRKELIITIDPSDAKDHDDAVSLTTDSNGNSVLGVHIADVSHFVTPGSAIDKDARAHANSVYMVDRFIPMLPPYLTSEICSLKAGRDRLAYSVFITFNARLESIDVEMKSSVVHPKLLLDYDRVQEILKGKEDAEIPADTIQKLKEMNRLALGLRKQRMRRGALDLSMPEVSCQLDEAGTPVDIHLRTSVEAYHLIEEFMLVANITVAERLSTSALPAIYRIHEEPSDDQWSQMSADLQQIGINEKPFERKDIQRILDQYKDQPLSYPVSISILRNFMRAIYSTDCTPHFGLAFDKYTHFTSPIRRYSDLVVHRILKSLDAGNGSFYSAKECEVMAEHCSQRERETAAAEEESLLIKRIQYYSIRMEKGETGPWPALITGGTSRGLLVEIVDTLQRGFVPIHTLPDPSARHDRNTGYITGRRGRKLTRIGEIIPVQLMRVDESKRMLELSWVHDKKETTESARRINPPLKKRRHRQRKR